MNIQTNYVYYNGVKTTPFTLIEKHQLYIIVKRNTIQ